MRTVLLTGSELRHEFFRKAIAISLGIDVLATYCEGTEKSLERLVAFKDEVKSRRLWHLKGRQQSEQDFFGAFVRLGHDKSNPIFIRKGSVNERAAEIRALTPDLIVSYGSSIIRPPLLTDFRGRFLNIHLGLSPYYRGSGTNFWPLVNNEPEYVGATFMHIDAGIDTGEIIHQLRARYYPGDTPHTVGNRLIADVVFVCAEIIAKYTSLPTMTPFPRPANERYYRKQDFTEESVDQVYHNFNTGLVERRLSMTELPPIVTNPSLVSEGVA